MDKILPYNTLRDTLLRHDMKQTPKQALHKLLVTAFRVHYDELAANGSKYVVANDAIKDLRERASISPVLYDEIQCSFMTEKRLNAGGLFVHKIINLWRMASPSTVDNMLRKASKEIGL